MGKLSTKLDIIKRVANYYNNTPENERLEFISGKWFIDHKEISSVRSYVIRMNEIESKKYHDKVNSRFDCASINEIDTWIDNYREYYLTENPKKLWWYESEYATKGREMAITSDVIYGRELPPLPFELNKKQLTIIGVMLYLQKEKVVFITTGISNSGKSTFGNIVQQLFSEDVSACSLSDLSNEFNVAEAIQHRLIYSDELSSDDLNNSIIKQLAAKEKVNCNPKNERPYTCQSQSVLLFNCNKPPRIDLQDTGMLTRIIYYCHNIPIKNPDPTLKDKVFTAEELTIIAAHAYLTINNKWRELFEEETFNTLIANNTVYLYMKYRQKTGKKPFYNISDNILGDDTVGYDSSCSYVSFCKSRGLKAFSETNYDVIVEYITERQDYFLKNSIL